MRSKGYKCYNYHCKGRVGDSPLCGELGDTALSCQDRVVNSMTNADRIRAMSDEELSKFLDRVELGDIDYGITFCDMCGGDKNNNELSLDCDGCRLHWLQQPAEEE